MKAREKKEEKIAKDAALAEKKRLQEETKTTKEFDKVDKDMKEKVILPKKKPIDWESPK
jgi:hypothetical protein